MTKCGKLPLVQINGLRRLATTSLQIPKGIDGQSPRLATHAERQSPVVWKPPVRIQTAQACDDLRLIWHRPHDDSDHCELGLEFG